MKTVDERQEYIRGKIAVQTVMGTIILLLGLSFLDSYDLFHILDYMEFTDFLINFCTVILMFVSLSLIWKDAYSGFMSQSQTKMVFYIFLIISILLECLFVYDLTMNDIFINSVFTLCLTNSISISLLCKRNDWSY